MNILVLATLIILAVLNEENRLIWLATIVAPIGGLSRHFLGKWLNSKSFMKKKLPYGTFMANVLGSVVLMTATVIATGWPEKQEIDDITNTGKAIFETQV